MNYGKITFNGDLWGEFVTSLKRAARCPSWVHSACILKNGRGVSISYELTEITLSYLEFLREQIELEPRGAEWTNVLKQRVVAMEPHVGRHVIRFGVVDGNRSYTLTILTNNGHVIHEEED